MTQIYRYQEIYKDLLKILDIQFLLPGTCPFEIPHERDRYNRVKVCNKSVFFRRNFRGKKNKNPEPVPI